MMKYLIEVEVDEYKLKACKCEGMSQEEIDDMSVEGMILEEMGWVDDSGIYVTCIREMESEVTGQYTEKMLGEEISGIINQDGEEKTDGQCIDEIINLLDKHGLYTRKAI